MPLPKRKSYTSEDYWSLIDGRRAELIDGQSTAYDVDKIINKIEMSSTDKDGVFIHVDKKQVITKELAIEIVKSGGAADE